MCIFLVEFEQCSFTESLCGWGVENHYNWTRLSGRTPTSYTGPHYDASLSTTGDQSWTTRDLTMLTSDLSFEKFAEINSNLALFGGQLLEHLVAVTMYSAGVYVYLEVSNQARGTYSDLTQTVPANACSLRLSYHMWGRDIGKLEVKTFSK